MKYLPLVLARGPMLAQIVRDYAQDPRNRRLCGCCGAQMVLLSNRPDQPARCPGCLRAEHVSTPPETPWRLTDAAAERLRRTNSWVRWV